MRFRHSVMVFLVLLSFGLTRFVWSQLTYTVPVVDKSDPGSPLKISGTASFTELTVSNSVRSSNSFRVDARNLSEKGVLLLRAYFDEAGPHGGRTQQVIQIDHFFWGQIGPGESFVLARKRPEGRASACCVLHWYPPTNPKPKCVCNMCSSQTVQLLVMRRRRRTSSAPGRRSSTHCGDWTAPITVKVFWRCWQRRSDLTMRIGS
jgi:hypothetical protein